MNKTQEQVCEEYFAAETVEDWLAIQFADFFGDGLETDAAQSAGADAMDRAVEGTEVMEWAELNRYGLASAAVVITDPDGVISEGAFFPQPPAPEALLLFCANHCNPVEHVAVVYTYYDGSQKAMAASWPFGMETAVELTAIPDIEDETPDGDDEEVEEASPLLMQAYMALNRFRTSADPVRSAVAGAGVVAILAAIFRRRRP